MTTYNKQEASLRLLHCSEVSRSMATRDEWYRPNLLYNIHWRSPDNTGDAPRTALVIKQYNPSVCSCHEHSPNTQHRMEMEVVKFRDEFEKLRKLNEIYKGCPDDKMKLVISMKKAMNKCDAIDIESKATFVEEAVCVQGIKDLIGLLKTRRQFSHIDECVDNISPGTVVADEAEETLDQLNEVCRGDLCSECKKSSKTITVKDKETSDINDITINGGEAHSDTIDVTANELNYTNDDSDVESVANQIVEHCLEDIKAEICVETRVLQEDTESFIPEINKMESSVPVTNIETEAEECPIDDNKELDLYTNDVIAHVLDNIVDELSAVVEVKSVDFPLERDDDKVVILENEDFDDSFGILKIYCCR